ncbi:hypothetical protein HDV64DRAFT_239915 [Trichoderma sp. TUCIM 5745]
MSRYLTWWADATTHRTRSSGWEDRLTAYMYACMTRMRYVTGHSCSLEIFSGDFLIPIYGGAHVLL